MVRWDDIPEAPVNTKSIKWDDIPTAEAKGSSPVKWDDIPEGLSEDTLKTKPTTKEMFPYLPESDYEKTGRNVQEGLKDVSKWGARDWLYHLPQMLKDLAVKDPTGLGATPSGLSEEPNIDIGKGAKAVTDTLGLNRELPGWIPGGPGAIKRGTGSFINRTGEALGGMTSNEGLATMLPAVAPGGVLGFAPDMAVGAYQGLFSLIENIISGKSAEDIGAAGSDFATNAAMLLGLRKAGTELDNVSVNRPEVPERIVGPGGPEAPSGGFDPLKFTESGEKLSLSESRKRMAFMERLEAEKQPQGLDVTPEPIRGKIPLDVEGSEAAKRTNFQEIIDAATRRDFPRDTNLVDAQGRPLTAAGEGEFVTPEVKPQEIIYDRERANMNAKPDFYQPSSAGPGLIEPSTFDGTGLPRTAPGIAPTPLGQKGALTPKPTPPSPVETILPKIAEVIQSPEAQPILAKVLETIKPKEAEPTILDKTGKGYEAPKETTEPIIVDQAGAKYEPWKPVESTGETKTSKISSDIAEDIGGDALTYNVGEHAVQDTKIAEIIKSDWEQAKRMAMLEEMPPKDVLHGRLYKRVVEQAKKVQDVDAIMKLKDSPASLEVTRAAQEVSGIKGTFDPHDPVSAIGVIEEARGGVAKIKTDTIKRELKAEEAKIKPNQFEFAGFLESIRCK